MTIPDSIEPYLGWKSLHLDEAGLLSSPQRGTPWPVGERLEAVCNNNQKKLTFHALRPEDPDPPDSYVIYTCRPGDTLIAFLPGFGSLTFTGMQEGCNRWVGVESVHTHEIAGEGCRCGIYVVDDPQECSMYFRPNTTVLAQIALWGRVRIGDGGARGQYAYPQHIYADRGLALACSAMFHRYEIPYTVLETIKQGGHIVTLPVKENT